ncbi:MAG TPA: squalene synthase HpnC [Ignavibacteriaceae bacterium]|nr:squalene synthase HpnC [Ignavibacteriaceae bacterium]
MKNDFNLLSAYNEAIRFTRSHYENFPVISFLIPKELYHHVAIIYWFARTADDIADEGVLSPVDRIKRLESFEQKLSQLISGNWSTNLEFALANTIKEKQLSPGYFFNLLAAFKQDVIVKRYQSYHELLNYCKKSANPVGRLILELYNIRDNELQAYSDKICTALQITNFLQDISIDYEKERIYIPQEDLSRFAVDGKNFEKKLINDNFVQLMEYQIQCTENLFNDGKQLIKFLPGRLKYEIKWTILGGLEILNLIRKNKYDIFNNRPKLDKKRFILLLIKSVLWH